MRGSPTIWYPLVRSCSVSDKTASWLSKEKAAKAVEYKHMTFYEAANLAKEAEVGEMWLTHYSPSLRHPEEYMDEVRAIFPHAIAGKDRMTTELDFPE